VILEDGEIIALYWDRNQSAIQSSDEKYGKYCYTIAWNILRQKEDSEECINDTWLRAWNAMPPEKPLSLKFFLSSITRNLAFDIYKKMHRQKRGAGQIDIALEELAECISDNNNPENELMATELSKHINVFLKGLKDRDRNVFIRRYYFVESAAEIGKKYELSERNVLMILSRTRKKLKAFLSEEGYVL